MRYLFSFCLVFLISSCSEKPKVYQYTEIVLEYENTDKQAKNVITWTVPQGWRQEAGNDIRLTSFSLIDHPQIMDCSIVSLSGLAGGVEANLKRWMGQINLESSEAKLASFMSSAKSLQTHSGLSAKIFDFTFLQDKSLDQNAQTIVAAVIMIDDKTIFIKMSAPISIVKQQRKSFDQLVMSLGKS